MDNSVITKSGWLRRWASEDRWEKNWVELYRDGYLKYYESDYSPNAEDVIFMPTECIYIKTGSHVEGMIPPDNHTHQSLFSVCTTNNKVWVFCGDTLDDMRAWQLALEQARLLIVRPPFTLQNSHFMNPLGSNLPHQLPNRLNGRLVNPYQSPFATSIPHTPSTTSYMPAFNDGSFTYTPSSQALNGSHFSRYASSQLHNLPLSGANYSFHHPSHNPQSMYSCPPLISPYQQPNYQRPDGRDLAMGMLARTAAGTMMWGPYLWY